MDRLDVVGSQRVRWKILEVEGHDALGASLNGCSQHMTVVRIGQIQTIDERLVTCDYAVGDCLRHEPPSAAESMRLQIRPRL